MISDSLRKYQCFLLRNVHRQKAPRGAACYFFPFALACGVGPWQFPWPGSPISEPWTHAPPHSAQFKSAASEDMFGWSPPSSSVPVTEPPSPPPPPPPPANSLLPPWRTSEGKLLPVVTALLVILVFASKKRRATKKVPSSSSGIIKYGREEATRSERAAYWYNLLLHNMHILSRLHTCHRGRSLVHSLSAPPFLFSQD